MSKEASIIEYTEIIIPLHELQVAERLEKALLYEEESIEREALLISAKLNELHIQYLKCRIEELRGNADRVKDLILHNKAAENKLRIDLDRLGIDVCDLL